jgi:monofunctional biosynthetic peptidoglycan transglycosylase
MESQNFFSSLWRIIKRTLLILFIAQFVYIILLKWIYPPLTITQFVSWITGHGLKRDYVNRNSISPNAKLAVIDSEGYET